VDELNQAYANLENIKATLAAQDEQIADLENQVASLEQQIENLQGENTTLLDTQNDCQLHTALLQARVNVINAQVALYEENPNQASALLEDTGELLNAVETMLPEDMKGVIAPLQARLDLALSELETAPDTATKDLSILAGDLLEIENTLFEGE
jgi:chromosome segregation ATPase